MFRLSLQNVSVSLWSIIHSYFRRRNSVYKKLIRVSVSLQSIIHSYNDRSSEYVCCSMVCFRLLTEYHSFLHMSVYTINHKRIIGFRLLTEYHSFLLYMIKFRNGALQVKFPSPYGVSFILTISNNEKVISQAPVKFPSPYGVSFILTYTI